MLRRRRWSLQVGNDFSAGVHGPQARKVSRNMVSKPDDGFRDEVRCCNEWIFSREFADYLKQIGNPSDCFVPALRRGEGSSVVRRCNQDYSPGLESLR